MSKLQEAGGQVIGELRPLLLFAGVIGAALFFVDALIWNVPHFSDDNTSAIAIGLAIWAGR
jgi:hypothetical protein